MGFQPHNPNCVNHVYRDRIPPNQRDAGRAWHLGCRRIGPGKQERSYRCALKTNTHGYATDVADCIPSNPRECRSYRARLRRNNTHCDYIYYAADSDRGDKQGN